MPVYLLAHGRQTRLPELSYPKQLLPLIGSEAILARTVRHVRVLTPRREIVLVAPDTSTWRDFAFHQSIERRSPSQTGKTIIETLLGLDVRGTVLLADVVFSRHCLRELLLAPSLAFVGRQGPSAVTGKPWGELFGFHVPPEQGPLVRYVLLQRRCGKLWDLLAHLGPLATFVPLPGDDYTDDVDLPEDLVKVLPVLRAAVRAEP